MTATRIVIIIIIIIIIFIIIFIIINRLKMFKYFKSGELSATFNLGQGNRSSLCLKLSPVKESKE